MRLAEGSLLVAGFLVASGCGQSKELTELCGAAEAKNVGEVRRLLQQGGVDLNADQKTMVSWRCRPFPEALQRVEPEALTEDRRGQEIATLMLDHKADPNGCWLLPRSKGRSSRGTSSTKERVIPPCVIEYAVSSQSPRFLRLVIDRGARVKGGAGARALAAAANAGNMEMARMLVEAGAPVNDVPESGSDLGSKTPALGAAIAGGHEDMIAYVRALPGAREFAAPSRASGLASAVSRWIGGQGGLTAAEQSFMSAAQTGDVEALEAAIAEGVQVDRLGDDGKSALIRASGAGHVAAVELLLKAGADPSLMNGGVTALHVAATDGHLEVIRVLVQAKANVNRRSSDTSDTPLMAAVKAEKPEVVRALIDAGADTTFSTAFMMPLEYAVWRANTAVVRELLKDGRTPVNARHKSAGSNALAEGSPLHGALWCRNPDYNIELIQTLLAAGAALSATDKNGDTPIKAAERKRAAEKLPYYQACYDAQVAALRAAATTR